MFQRSLFPARLLDEQQGRMFVKDTSVHSSAQTMLPNAVLDPLPVREGTKM